MRWKDRQGVALWVPESGQGYVNLTAARAQADVSKTWRRQHPLYLLRLEPST